MKTSHSLPSSHAPAPSTLERNSFTRLLARRRSDATPATRDPRAATGGLASTRAVSAASGSLVAALTLFTATLVSAQETPDFVWARGGHAGFPTRLTYSPDGTLFASCANDGSAKLWGASDGQLVRSLVADLLPFPWNNTVSGLAFSADGATLATATWIGNVHLWNVADGTLLRTITMGGMSWNTVAFSPDGQYVVAGGLPAATIRMWDTGTGALVRSFIGHTDMVNDVEFSPDGLHLASASRDRTVRVWEVATGSVVWSAVDAHDFETVAIDYSFDGTVVASAGGVSQPQVKTWNASTGAAIRTYMGQTHPSMDVEFSPDGSEIGGSGGDGQIRIWSTATGTLLRSIPASVPPDGINFDFSPDGSSIVAGDASRRVTQWDAVTGVLIREASAHPGWVHALDFAPNGSALASAAFVIPLSCPVKVYDPTTGEVLEELGDTPWGLTDARYSPTGRYLAGSSGSGVTYLVDLTDVSPDHTIPVSNPPDFPWFARFSPDETQLVTGGTERTIQLWSVASPPQLLDFIDFGTASPQSAVFTPDGSRVVIALGPSIVVWDLEADTQDIFTFAENQNVSDLAMAPDGLTFFASHGTGTAGVYWIRQLELDGFAETRRFVGHSAPIHSIDLSADGRYLISGGADFTVRLWSVQDEALLLSYDQECGFETTVGFQGVPRVVFSPDDRVFAYGRNDGTIAVARNPFAPTADATGVAHASESSLSPATPNPFSRETSVEFRLDRRQSIDLNVVDATGRIVRTLLADNSGPGVYGVTWDGRNEAGSPVANGVYWIRLGTPDESAQSRVVVLR